MLLIIVDPSRAIALPCDGKYQAAHFPTYLPPLPATACPTNTNSQYANRIIQQNFRVDHTDITSFRGQYLDQLTAQGWKVTNEEKIAVTSQFYLIRAAHPSGFTLHLVLNGTGSASNPSSFLTRVILIEEKIH